MEIKIEPLWFGQPPKMVRVVIDLLDGKSVLRSDPMSYSAARDMKAELERRIFECQEGAASGRRDRM